MGNKAMDTSLFDKAMHFAIDAHRNTERRGKQSPYIVHPMEAVEIVATITNDQELLAAAALHDVVEDTEYTEEDIRREFGDRIAELVANESDPVIEGKNHIDSWKERKLFGIERLRKAPLDVKIVAMGDKLSNLRAMARDYSVMGDKLWDIFHAPDPSLHEWRYRALLAAFEGLEDTFPYKEFASLITQIWGEEKAEIRKINLEEWDEFGGGYTAKSYYSNVNDNEMMKLYEAFMPESEPRHEYEVSRAISKTGLDIPRAFAMAETEDGRHGVIFERIKNKVSVAKAIANEPEKLDELAETFGRCVKKLHTVPCDKKLFRDIRQTYIAEIEKAMFFSDMEKEKLIRFVRNVPDADTSLHGDCHIGNMLLSEGRTVWIDLADWSYGDPLFDVGTFYFVTHIGNEQKTMNLYHINETQMKRVWEKFVEVYFPGENLEDVNEKVKPFAFLKTIGWANRSGLNENSDLLPGIEYLKNMKVD